MQENCQKLQWVGRKLINAVGCIRKTNGILASNLPIEILGQVENGKVRRAALDFDGTISFIHA